jgi:hypothetical protein
MGRDLQGSEGTYVKDQPGALVLCLDTYKFRLGA